MFFNKFPQRRAIFLNPNSIATIIIAVNLSHSIFMIMANCK